MKRIVHWLLVGAVLVLFTACGGGSSGGDDTSNGNDNQTNTINGVAQLGFIKDATVSVYSIKNLGKPIATTKTSNSTDISKAGRFSFKDIEVDYNKYYLITVSKGKDIDADDNGQIDSSFTDLNGTVHAVVSGSDLKSNIRVNALTDMAYRKIESQIASLTNNQIKEFLTKDAQKYLFDVNGDGKVDNKDLIKFNPVRDRDKIKTSYRDILDLYVPLIHSNKQNDAILASLMYIDSPKISIKNGELQEVPFQLKASVENLPKGIDVKWKFNDTNTSNLDESIKEDGIYRVTALLYKNDKLIKTLSSDVIATTKTPIASLNAKADEDSQVYVTVESNSSLAGTQIVIPKGALKEDTKITVKKASINAVPSDGKAIGISDVLVLEPSGMTFDRPVQIKLPYDENLDLNISNVRIVRYSKGGKVDYIAPLYIDKEHHEIVFETEHFTEFKAETDYIGDSDDEKFINALNQAFPEYKRDISKWKSILNVPIDKTKKVTVFDYLKTYIENKRIYEIIEQHATLNKDGTLDYDYNAKYDFPYISALKYLYPDVADYSHAVQMWNDIKDGFKLMDYVQNVGGTTLNLLKGEIYRDFIETVLGIPTTASNFSIYTFASPTDIGTGIIKVVVNLQNNEYIKNLVEYVYMDQNGKFYYKNELQGTIKDFLEENGIRWIAEDMVRRYKSYELDPEKQLKNARELIKQSIEYVKNLEEIEKAKEDPQANLVEISRNIYYDPDKDTKKTIEYKMSLYGYTNSLSLNFSIMDKDGNVIIDKDEIKSYCTIDDNENSVRRICSGDFELDLSKVKDYKLIMVRPYKNNLLIDDKLDSQDNYIHLREKKHKKVEELLHGGRLDENGDFFVAITPRFRLLPIPPVDVVGSFNGRTLGEKFTIAKEDFNKTALKHIVFKVSLKDEAKNSYVMDDFIQEINIKELIDKALQDKQNNEEPKVLPIPELKATTSRTINVGDSVTFSLDKTNIKSIIREDFGGTASYINDEDKYRIDVIYSSSGMKFPKIQVEMKDGTVAWIRSESITVKELESEELQTNEAPIAYSPALQIVSSNSAKYIAINAYDPDGDSLTLECQQPSLGSIEVDGLRVAYIAAIEEDADDSFKCVVRDDKGGVSNEIEVKVKVTYIPPIEKYVDFMSESSPQDSCTQYESTNCDIPLVERGSSFIKSWEIRNSGNVKLRDLKVVKVSGQSGLNVEVAQEFPTMLDVDVSGEYKLSIKVPKNARPGVHQALFKLTSDGKDLQYENGQTAYFWYKVKIKEDIPTIALNIVPSASAGSVFTFVASLSKPLGDDYTVKISLGDNGGGWLNPIDMILSKEDRTEFALAQKITKAGGRKYRVAIFYNDTQVSQWIEGSYTVIDTSNIPKNLTISQTEDGALLSWNAVEGAQSYVPLASLDFTKDGDYADITSGCEFKSETSCLVPKTRFTTHKEWYFSVRADNGEMAEPIKFVWIDENNILYDGAKFGDQFIEFDDYSIDFPPMNSVDNYLNISLFNREKGYQFTFMITQFGTKEEFLNGFSDDMITLHANEIHRMIAFPVKNSENVAEVTPDTNFTLYIKRNSDGSFDIWTKGTVYDRSGNPISKIAMKNIKFLINKFDDLAGKTFYVVEGYNIIEVRFSSDLSYIEYKNSGIDGGSTKIVNTALDSNGLKLIDEADGTSYLIIKSAEKDYLLMENADITEGGVFLAHNYEFKLYLEKPVLTTSYGSYVQNNRKIAITRAQANMNQGRPPLFQFNLKHDIEGDRDMVQFTTKYESKEAFDNAFGGSSSMTLSLANGKLTDLGMEIAGLGWVGHDSVSDDFSITVTKNSDGTYNLVSIGSFASGGRTISEVVANNIAFKDEIVADLNAIIGKTVYEYCTDNSELFRMTFQNDGQIKIQEGGATKYIPYRIDGNTIYSTEYGTEDEHLFLGFTDTYVKFDEGNNETSTFYFTEADARANPVSGCGGGDEYNPGGVISYKGINYEIKKARAYESDMPNNEVQIFLSTDINNVHKKGGIQFTIKKDVYPTVQALRKELKNNGVVYLDKNDMIEYGVQFMTEDNNPTGVEWRSGKLKLTWLDNNKFDLKFIDGSMGIVKNINDTNTTIMTVIYMTKTVVKIDEDNQVDFTKISDLVAGHFDFVDENNSVITNIPSNLWVRITPEDNQIEGNWNGVNCKIDSNGNFGDECYIHNSEEDMRKKFSSSYDKTYQIVIYQETTGDTHYNKEESQYGHIKKEGDVYKVNYGEWQNFKVIVYNNP